MLPADERFEFIDDEALQAKIDGLRNKNTTKADAKAAKQIGKYLKKKRNSRRFWEQELDKILSTF